jgi:transglutaminase-like putative cysteine protease
MQLRIRHETVYAYEHPVPYSLQLLRLTPRPHAGLHVASWRIASDRRRSTFRQLDGFGNVTHAHVVREPHTRLTLVAEGVVETHDTTGIVRGAPEPLPPPYYLRSTPLTAPAAALAALAVEAGRGADPLARLHRLLALVHERVDYLSGVGYVRTTAADALRRGAGVCQDLAHVFVAAARLLDCPARCVGGYLWGGDEDDPDGAGHAWAEAHHPDVGWIGFDAVRGTCTGARHVPCAVGLDYRDAAPVHGVRRALGAEDLTVRVAVAEVQQQ